MFMPVHGAACLICELYIITRTKRARASSLMSFEEFSFLSDLFFGGKIILSLAKPVRN
jgi:hypothetical protein